MSTTTDLARRPSARAPERHQPGALAIRAGQTEWDQLQQAAFGQLGIKDAPDGDKAVFLHVSQRTGLDPFSRQIYMIPRPERVPGTRDQWTKKWTIQTGIEGWRVIRDRAERREGVRGKLSRATWYDEEGTSYPAWVRREPPAACELTYTVRDANDIETEYTSTLQFWEYAQTKEINGQVTLIAQWAVKKSHMLEKCTEADVYRKAFPQDYSGVYLDDSMPAPDPDAPVTVQSEQVRVTSDQARARQRPQTVASTATVIPDVPPAQSATPPAEPAQPPHQGAGGTRTPAKAQDGQIGTIQVHFKRLGYTDSTDDRVSRLSATGKLAGYDGDLLTTNDLSAAQAARVLLALGKCRDAQALTDLLDAGIAPEATDGE